MDEPMKLGRGQIFFGDNPTPIGHAEGLEITPRPLDYNKLVKQPVVTIRMTGVEISPLWQMWFDELEQFTRMFRKRYGRFYPKRRTRSMKGK